MSLIHFELNFLWCKIRSYFHFYSLFPIVCSWHPNDQLTINVNLVLASEFCFIVLSFLMLILHCFYGYSFCNKFEIKKYESSKFVFDQDCFNSLRSSILVNFRNFFSAKKAVGILIGIGLICVDYSK